LSTLLNHSLIAAALCAIIVTLLIVHRGRLKTAWGGHVLPMINALGVAGVVLVANALLRTYVY
jgi:hypothetical protein